MNGQNFNTSPAFSPHVSEESLEQYALGAGLAAVEADLISDHLTHCRDCLARLEGLSNWAMAVYKLTRTSPDAKHVRPVLVVDDSQTVRILIRKSLHARGFRVKEATDCIEAQRILRTESISLVIANLWMSGVDGVELLNHLWRHHRDLPKIGISRAFSPYAFQRAQDLGIREILSEPISGTQIAEITERMLCKPAAILSLAKFKTETY